MATIKEIIERSDTKTGKAFDLFIQAMIVVSLVSFSIETLPSLAEKTQRILWFIQTSVNNFLGTIIKQ